MQPKFFQGGRDTYLLIKKLNYENYAYNVNPLPIAGCIILYNLNPSEIILK